MAKGQKRGNREIRKQKAPKTAAPATPVALLSKGLSGTGGGQKKT